MMLFAIMTGGGAATIRALVMGLIAILARYFGRSADALRALAFAAAAMARRDDTLVVATALATLRLEQILHRLRARRQLGEVAHRGAAAAGSRRIVFANSHDFRFRSSAISFQLSAFSFE